MAIGVIMGFFSDLFGGTDRSAQKEQIRANKQSQGVIEEASERARGDLLSLFGDAQQMTRAGSQAALDVQGQVIPQQFSVFQQGNRNAQNALGAGVRDARSALLGLPFQQSFSAPPIQVDTGFAQQTLPELPQQQPQQQALGGLTPEIIQFINSGQFGRRNL